MNFLRVSWLVFLFPLAAISSVFPVNILVSAEIPQNAYDYIPQGLDSNKPIISEKDQKQFHAIFLNRYFIPWSNKSNPQQFCFTADNQHCVDILKFEKNEINSFISSPGYDNYYNPHSADWALTIKKNMNLSARLCSSACSAITVNNAFLRILPTTDASYLSVKEPGQGYPFDSLQISTLWLGAPIRILLQSVDKKWYLIDAAGMQGWVEAKNIARVDKTIQKLWRTAHFSSFTSLKLSVHHRDLYFGSLLPYQRKGHHLVVLFIPEKEPNGYAKLVRLKLSNNLIKPWPLNPTPNEFSRVINLFLGMTYGWGGLHDDTDCSGTLKRMFANFGIWLPRNSGLQGDFSGKKNSLPADKFTVAERKAILLGRSKGLLPKPIPYLTLITFQDALKGPIGHVALYINPRDAKELIIFQSVWGLQIENNKKGVGRVIIGKAALTKMKIGANINLHDNKLKVQTLWQVPGLNYTIIRH